MLFAAAQIAAASVPSTINYQGRLTNAAGVPQPGSRVMSIKIYDAAASGVQVYSENIGNVTVDDNGVYSFQFGDSGTSNTSFSETIGVTNGTSLTFQKNLINTNIVSGSVSVTDGTYSWNEIAGNPGPAAEASATITNGFVIGAMVTHGGSGYTSAPPVTITGNGTGATATATVSNGVVTGINITNAGSGYTISATITISPPPAPFLITYTGDSIAATYATAPVAGRTITAAYRYTATGITNALGSGTEQWLELTVDSVVQMPRQKILTVPFAQRAAMADKATTAESAPVNFSGYQMCSSGILYQAPETGFIVASQSTSIFRDMTCTISVGETSTNLAIINKAIVNRYSGSNAQSTVPVMKGSYWIASEYELVRFIPFR
jgi:hypothetical protein